MPIDLAQRRLTSWLACLSQSPMGRRRHKPIRDIKASQPFPEMPSHLGEKATISLTAPSKEAAPDPVDRINSRLANTSVEVTKEVHNAIEAALQAEQGRSAGIDARAMSMIGAAGLSMTVIFTFGPYLVKNELRYEGLGLRIVVVLYVLALLSGILSALFSLFATYVRDNHPVADDEAIFRVEALGPEGTALTYKKQLCVHFASVRELLISKHTRKLAWLKKAQVSFVVFLFLVSLLGGTIGMSSIN